MQTKNYDSTFCGSVPLHQINLIQPYGILLILQRSDYKIVQVSENIGQALELPPAEVVNTLLSRYIPATQLEQLQKRVNEGIVETVPFTLSFSNKDYLVLMQVNGESVILEMEAQSTPTTQNSFITIYQQLKYAMAAINAAPSIGEACQIAASQLKELSGYDKVMVYQFDNNWNGTVLAEDAVPEMEKYLGLTFPASDIPKQARAMYLKNPYRLIPNRDYVPVSLYPIINPLTNAFTDLSGCNLRSVPAVHLEYMKNMEIMTSMSCRILKDGQLWGLFSCHHRTPFYLPYEGRALFELLSDIISARIISLQYKEESDEYADLHDIQTRLVEQVYISNDLLTGLFGNTTNVLQLFNATGAAMVFNKRMESIGTVPDKHALKDLLLWLQSTAEKSVYQELSLPAVYEPFVSYAKNASGILVISIQPQKGDFLVLFRPEVIREVKWGGNPDEAIRFEKDNIQYHPRNSFSIWQQQVRNTALPWRETELTMAEHLRNFILEYIVKAMD
ncbi:GAF domain-containing protein [Chitinophaga sancti]|uniref:GAF domain-containing protein n=1 Tax=Chitinophaga sancti TaxID=1004 RepID=UPI002A75AD35|nr:GAF domain-containing protein [Chitinophaga sancti]WPQ63138.1 GAF domain-containing protein [Chitinophaga sancti]